MWEVGAGVDDPAYGMRERRRREETCAERRVGSCSSDDIYLRLLGGGGWRRVDVVWLWAVSYVHTRHYAVLDHIWIHITARECKVSFRVR